MRFTLPVSVYAPAANTFAVAANQERLRLVEVASSLWRRARALLPARTESALASLTKGKDGS